MSRFSTTLILLVSLLGLSLVYAEDPYLFFTWKMSYGTISPLGKPQKVIMINNQFPGPVINCTSNNNIVINVFNNLDEPFLFTWNGIQHRKNSWQDGLAGTNCPILPGKNFTYHWQPKDQIGTYFYFPSLGMQKAAGAFGPMRVHSRLLIPVPFAPPADEFDVLAGDWYDVSSHKELQSTLDAGRTLNRPDAVLINGKSGDEDEKVPMFTVEAGKTYRFRVCNVGLKASLNFRIQGHKLKLVEMEGSHTVQNMYDSMDVHVGQCFSVLVDADQDPSDYFLVASTRFLKEVQTGTAIIRYKGSKGRPSSSVLPGAPTGWPWSLNQWRSFRWNLTASAARPNPQGSYHYGQINITRTIKIVNTRIVIDGKPKYALNGISHKNPETPLKLAEYFNVSNVFEYNLIGDEPPKTTDAGKVAPNVITAEFRTFIEIVFENPEKNLQSYHLDGYSFFPAGMGPGKWTPESRKTYNLLDTVSRHTVQVYQNSWTAIMLTFDNAGMWNLRSMIWDRQYLGQQLYISVISPARSLRDEYNMPENALRCGKVVGLPLPPPYAAA